MLFVILSIGKPMSPLGAIVVSSLGLGEGVVSSAEVMPFPGEASNGIQDFFCCTLLFVQEA